LSVLYHYPINYLRGSRLSFTSRIGKGSVLRNSQIGKYTYIAKNCILNNTVIGNYCSIAPNVQIGGMEHPYEKCSTSTFLSKIPKRKETLIGNDVWIAAGCIIKQGVKIGDGAVIGAMSFVNRDVPDNSIYVGIPAKLLKKRMDDALFQKIKESGYWFHNPEEAKKILSKLDEKADLSKCRQ